MRATGCLSDVQSSFGIDGMQNQHEKLLRRLFPWIAIGTLLAIVLGGVLAVGVSVALRSHLFDWNAPIGSKELTALWSFVGAGIGAAVALLVAVFTWSYNNRTNELAKEAESRQRAAEERMRHEAVAGFLSVLTTDAGHPAGPAQTVGTVHALKGLGHSSLALAIVETTVQRKDLDGHAAARLISLFLDESSEDEKKTAAGLLRDVAGDLADTLPRTFEWPDAVYRSWRQDLPSDARIDIIVALGTLLASRNRSWWEGGLSWAVHLLLDALSSDPDSNLRGGAAELLKVILESFNDSGTSLRHTGRVVTVREGLNSIRVHSDKCGIAYVDISEVTEKVRAKWNPIKAG
jgi:hypothetical protein